MSGFEVIRRVGETLRDVLNNGFAPSAVGGELLGTARAEERITLGPPILRNNMPLHPLSVWLYLVTEQEHSRNRPRTVLPNGSTIQPPLALSLYYLVTPGGLENAQPEVAQLTAQTILGRVMQIFHSQPIIALLDPARGVAEELHLGLCRPTLEELTRVWEALQQPYQLSICYRVNIARIDSLQVNKSALVVERDLGYGELERAAG